jgi:carbonic anhydrase
MSAQSNLSCLCCNDLMRGAFSRRRFIAGAAATGAALAMAPFAALAAEGHYEAMVLGCIDPRLQEPMHRYTARRGLTGKFSQFIMAGAAIGVVAEPFKDWRKAFWDNLATSVQLHHIKRVIAIDHRDCGAAKIAYGADKVANRTIETATHRAAMAEFRKEMNERQPALKVETGLMGLNGRIEMLM